MPVGGLLTTLAKMSIHKSGIQGTEGAWRVGHHHMWMIFLLRVWHCLLPKQSTEKNPYTLILCGSTPGKIVPKIHQHPLLGASSAFSCNLVSVYLVQSDHVSCRPSREERVKTGGQGKGTKMKWRNRKRQGEGEAWERKHGTTDKGKGKREVNLLCEPEQKRGVGKGVPKPLHISLAAN